MSGQPSAPRASPRTESAFAELHSMRQQRGPFMRVGGTSNPMADSAASVILPRQMGGPRQRPSSPAGQQRTPIAEEEVGSAGSGAAGPPSGAPSGGNPFRDAVSQPQGQCTPSGNPFADAPAQSPAQPANTPYSVPSGNGLNAREAASSMHWRTNLAASWEVGIPGSNSIGGHEEGLFMGPWPAHDEHVTLAPLGEGPLALLRAPWERSAVGGGIITHPVPAAT